MPTKIVFLGSKPIGYDCLAYLIGQSKTLDLDICAVRTHKRKEFGSEKDIAVLAQVHHIPLLDSLDEIPECDLVYSVQHHELLKEQHIRKARAIAVNLHLAPLPEYRGCNQFSFAIMDEIKQFGVTIHEMDTRIDHGAILFQKRFPVPENCWVKMLYDLTVREGLDLFKNTLPALISGDYEKKVQQVVPPQRTRLYFRSEINNLKQIDLNRSRLEIEKQIRATCMPGFEPPYCVIDGKYFYFNLSDKQ